VTPPVSLNEAVATTVRRAVALLSGVEFAPPPPVAITPVVHDGPVDRLSIYRELASLAEDGAPSAPRGMTA